jgi:hypothetical protein
MRGSMDCGIFQVVRTFFPPNALMLGKGEG